MWAWIGVFLQWALDRAGSPLAAHSGLLTFALIAAGAPGCVIAGRLADRHGRTTVTMAAMAISGSSAALIGLTPALGTAAILIVALVWSITIIADSAQFSASIAELSPPELVGTMLTLQTCMGFLLTFLIIQAVPLVVAATGWRWGFAFLAIGPAWGVLAMWRLRQRPDARRLASGRR